MGAATAIVFAVQLLTLEEAVKSAEERQPQLLMARAQSEQARGRADQALSPMLPQLSLQATYQRTTANFAPRPSTVPRSLTQGGSTLTFDTFNFFNFSLSANQLIWDFQAFDRYRASLVGVEAQDATMEAARLLAVQGARTAFFAARAQKALVVVARETLDNQERHLKQIQGFVELGARAEIDLAQARADRANARVSLINAENGYESAKVQLNQAMGVERGTDFDVADEAQAPVENEDATTDVLVDEALRARPDLSAIAKQLRAQELTIAATRGGYWPSLSTGMAASAAGTEIENLGLNWNANLSLGWNFFQGGVTRGQVREARAQMAIIEAQRAQLRLQARTEVEQARLAVRAAKGAVEASGEAVAATRERLRLAEGRYQTGVGNTIELSDAQLGYTQASAQRVQAEYNLAAARAQLLRALGRR